MSVPEVESAHPAVPVLTGPQVSGITRLTAIDTVRARIALAIELRLLPTGEALPSDAEVAAALGVSETTARRALRSLADDGVLRRVRGRSGGTFVADPGAAARVHAAREYRADATTVHRLIDERLMFEVAMTHFAAAAATDADLEELEKIVAVAAIARDWAEYHAADERFHLALAAAAHRPQLTDRYRDTLERLYAYFIPYPIEYLHDVNQEHADVVDALRRGDASRAVEIIEHHIAVLHDSMFVGLGDN